MTTLKRNRKERAAVDLDAAVTRYALEHPQLGQAKVAEALQAQGFKVEKAQVHMPNGPLKMIGDHPWRRLYTILEPDTVVPFRPATSAGEIA